MSLTIVGGVGCTFDICTLKALPAPVFSATVTMQPMPAASIVIHSAVFESEQSSQTHTSLLLNGSAKLSTGNADGSLSASYTGSTNSTATAAHFKAWLEKKTAQQALPVGSALEPAFLAVLDKLPAKISDPADQICFYDFFQHYGTHYISHVSLGGVFLLECNAFASTTNKNHNIEVKASCESMLQNLFSKCNVNLHASNSSSSSSNQKGQTYCVKYSGGILNGSDLQSLNDQLKGVGSDEKASQSTISQWFNSVDSHLAVVDRTLVPFTHLLQANTAKLMAMKEALDLYKQGQLAVGHSPLTKIEKSFELGAKDKLEMEYTITPGKYRIELKHIDKGIPLTPNIKMGLAPSTNSFTIELKNTDGSNPQALQRSGVVVNEPLVHIWSIHKHGIAKFCVTTNNFMRKTNISFTVTPV